MFTKICQWVFDFFTIFADLLIREPIEIDKDYQLQLACLVSIILVAFSLGAICNSLIHRVNSNKKPIINLINITIAIIATLGTVLSTLLSVLLHISLNINRPTELPKITPSFTHTVYSNIIVDSSKKQIYANNSNVNFQFSYHEDDTYIYLDTEEFNDIDIESAFNDNTAVIGDLTGIKGESSDNIKARLKKENIRIVKTEDAKKYPKYVSYKVSKIKVKSGTLTKTAYHQTKNLKFKELYLELTAVVEPNKLKDAQQDAKEQENQKDIDQLMK